ncbi:MAG: hypothetical protein HY735_04025 [Verrucomicrobia bacterium]|nr:hypothetical protein [Verrucomicrobiota bacterium]
MKWSDVCADPPLQDLAYKIELNAPGQIIMSPNKPIHSGLQGAIQRLLYELKPDGGLETLPWIPCEGQRPH